MYTVETILGCHSKGKDVSSFDEIIRRGIPLTASENVKKVLQLTDKEFVEMIGVSLSSLLRMRKKQGRWSELISDRLFRLARIFVFAVEVLGSEDRARQWLRRPQIGLGGKVPLNLLETDAGAKDVENLLGGIKYGVVL